MKLLIDIPEEDYKYIINNCSIYFTHIHNIINGIIYGKIIKNFQDVSIVVKGEED